MNTHALARPNRFEIDLNAVASCTRQVRALLGPDITFFATLKANAYGYGLLPTAKVVLAHGADALSLASLPDAIALRAAGIQTPILVYAGLLPTAEVVEACEHYRLMPTLHNAELLDGYARHASRPISVAVKVDVGPERIGVPIGQAQAFITAANRHPLLHVDLINAHPNVRGGARADACMAWQHEQMMQLGAALDRAGCAVKWRMMASSKVLRMSGSTMLLNAADPGAALFQALDPGSLPPGAGQPFRALKSALIEVRRVARTEYLDEAPFDVRPGMRIGVLPIGYSDNVHRLHAGCALVRGRRVPLVGNAALEYMRIDLTDVPNAQVGDEVVLIGTQGGSTITPEEAAKHQQAARVIDLALQVGAAIPRHYLPAG